MITKKKIINKSGMKLRKVGKLYIFILFFIIFYFLLHLFTIGREVFNGEKAVPVSLHITGPRFDELSSIELLRLSPRNKICHVPQYDWNNYKENFRKILLVVPENLVPRITNIDIKIGRQSFSYSNKDFIRQWKKIPNGILPITFKSRDSEILDI